MNIDEPIPYKLTTEAMLLDDLRAERARLVIARDDIRILTENNVALQAELDDARLRLDAVTAAARRVIGTYYGDVRVYDEIAGHCVRTTALSDVDDLAHVIADLDARTATNVAESK